MSTVTSRLMFMHISGKLYTWLQLLLVAEVLQKVVMGVAKTQFFQVENRHHAKSCVEDVHINTVMQKLLWQDFEGKQKHQQALSLFTLTTIVAMLHIQILNLK